MADHKKYKKGYIKNTMNIGIDASNIRAGGGITHLIEILSRMDPEKFGIEEVIVWGGKKTIDLLPNRNWLNKSHHPLLDQSLLFRVYWQIVNLTRFARMGCDLLFVPGGSYLGNFHPFITMSRNMLPFDKQESKRYGLSSSRLRLLWLRIIQLSTFRRADGIIFLNDYAEEELSRYFNSTEKQVRVIPHGIDERFFREPVSQLPISHYSNTHPINLLYVSHIDYYKHQWHVVKAVGSLFRQGVPVQLTLVGRIISGKDKYQDAIKEYDPNLEFVNYLGEVDYSKIEQIYQDADIFIYASSCENLPNTLLESMAAGLPIASSNVEPMPSVLGDAGLYFNPEEPDQLEEVLLNYIKDPGLREKLAIRAYNKARSYSWESCTSETFSFIVELGD